MLFRILTPTILLSIALLSLLPDSTSTGTPGSPTQAAPPDTGVAVVELFTSEGCSSCPPADRLLRTLVGEARTEGRPIYALSFHVDYWNNLGWEDPYSDPAYSERQRSSAEALGARVYTPQAIVNGTEVVVGSREREVRSAVQSALSTPAPVSLRLRLRSDTASSLSVHAAAPEAPKDADARGPGGARPLSVRSPWRKRRSYAPSRQRRSGLQDPPGADASGRVPQRPPPELDPSRASVIAYVQDPTSRQVLGAARVDLEGSAP